MTPALIEVPSASRSKFRIGCAIWMAATLLIAVFLWLRAVEVAPQEFDTSEATIKVNFQLAGEPLISLETDAAHRQSSLWSLQIFATLGFILLSLTCMNAIWLSRHRNLLRWLDGPARVSLLGGFFIYGAVVIYASRHFVPATIQVNFFAALFGVLSTYALMVTYLAAGRDMAEGRPGPAALISRIGIESIAWITGAVGCLAVVVALVGKFLLLFVR